MRRLETKDMIGRMMNDVRRDFWKKEFERIKGEEYVKWIESQDTYTPMEWVDYLSNRK